MKVGESLDVRVGIDLGALTPEDVKWNYTDGMLNLSGEIADPTVLPMAASGKPKGSVFEYLLHDQSRSRADARGTPSAFFLITRISTIRLSKGLCYGREINVIVV